MMTYKNTLRLKPPPIMIEDSNGAAASKLPVMQDASIHWNGQPVACVVAETQEQADHAAALVRITYAAEPGRTSFESAKLQAVPPANILGEASKIAVGDAEAALAQAPFRLDATYATPRYNHGPSSCMRSPWHGRTVDCWCTTPRRWCTSRNRRSPLSSDSGQIKSACCHPSSAAGSATRQCVTITYSPRLLRRKLAVPSGWC
jgi:CO/xanthine dehydrogenase Mo-binding subunit